MIALLTSRLAGPIAAGIAVLLALALGWQTMQLAAVRSHLKVADAAAAALYRNLETCKANTATLSEAVASQNAATEAMRAETDARAKMLADGLQQARRGRAGAEARASALLTRPPAGIDACARAEAARDAVIRSLQP